MGTTKHCYIQNIEALAGPCGFREEDIFSFFPIVSVWELSVAMETTILIQSATKPDAINPQPNDDSHYTPVNPISSPEGLRLR